MAIFQVAFEDYDHEKKKMLEKENESFKLHNETSHLENALEDAEKEK